ncbi:MAG: hypothetical protein HFH91_01150 [Lachnospiraceae bacterium]|nr:hypothetical protein [Lachnospiraceae bacterium]
MGQRKAVRQNGAERDGQRKGARENGTECDKERQFGKMRQSEGGERK